jgi:Domain of unknown function (DUF1707)
MNPAVRAGDADRQQVVAELQRHYVDGRLSTDELSERVDRALAARTFGELDVLLADLPTEPRVPETPRTSWLTPFVTFPGVLLVGMLAMLIITWLLWLPNGNAPVWPVFILGGVFFFGRSPRIRGRRR